MIKKAKILRGISKVRKKVAIGTLSPKITRSKADFRSNMSGQNTAVFLTLFF